MDVDRHGSSGLAYRSFGDERGPLVLCLHGFPDIPRTWDLLGQDLAAAGYRVVVPWMPGYTPSSLGGPRDPLSVADRLLRFLDDVAGAVPVHIVGHDWGAVCTYLMLYMAPRRFRSAVTLAVPHLRAIERNGPDVPRQLLKSSYMLFFQLPSVPERVLRLRDFAFVEKLWKIWSPGFECDAAYMTELTQCLGASLPAPLAYYRSFRSPKLIRSMRALLGDEPMNVPMLYLHGEQDGCMVPELGKGQEKYYGAMFDSMHFSEAGHFLHLEQPAVCNPVILDWIRSHTPSD